MWKIAGLIVAALAALSLGGAAYVRLAPMRAEVWHVDPRGVTRSGKPNDYLLGATGDAPALAFDHPPAQVAGAALAAALALPRAQLLAGDAESGWFTVVTRTALMGYPDAISVRVVAEGAGSAVHVYARARYGYSDMGVNARNVARLAQTLAAALAG